MTVSLEEFLRVGKTRGYLTYSEVHDYLANSVDDPEKLDVFLCLLEAHEIDVRQEINLDEKPVPRCHAPEPLYHRYTDEQLAGWKTYPIRLLGAKRSPCHNQPTLLVQSMNGGFVTANCSECSRKFAFTRAEFSRLALWVACPRCKTGMEPEMLSRVVGTRRLAPNYGYSCAKCRAYILLADLLPKWSDIAEG